MDRRLIKNSVDNNLWIVGLLKTQLIINHRSKTKDCAQPFDAECDSNSFLLLPPLRLMARWHNGAELRLSLYNGSNKHEQIMKRFFLYAAVAAVCVSCGGKKAGYTIDGKIAEGHADLEGKYVYLIPYGSDGAAIDSALIEKDAFKLQGEPKADGLYTLYVKGGEDEMMSRFGEAPFSTVFVLEKGEMQAVLDSMSISGS